MQKVKNLFCKAEILIANIFIAYVSLIYNSSLVMGFLTLANSGLIFTI